MLGPPKLVAPLALTNSNPVLHKLLDLPQNRAILFKMIKLDITGFNCIHNNHRAPLLVSDIFVESSR